MLCRIILLSLPETRKDEEQVYDTMIYEPAYAKMDLVAAAAVSIYRVTKFDQEK